MENPIFVDDENIPLVIHHDKNCESDHDDDYKNYNTPNTSKVNMKTFMTPRPTNKQATSTLWLGKKVKQNNLAALYRHLKVKVI